MASSCDFRTSEASVKSHFRTNNLIDKYLNILDLAGFRKANTKWSNYARQQYGTEGRLFFEENNGTKAIPNSELFKQIDAKKGIFYEMESDSSSPLIELENKLKDKLKQVGVNVNILDRVTTERGNNAVAKADLLQGVIEVVEGTRSANTLPEEAAHIFFELLPDGHPLKEGAMRKIEGTEMYKIVAAQYGEEYEGNIEALKKEAVGKLIAQEILGIYKETEEKPGIKSWLKTWWDVVVKYFKNRFKTTLTGAQIAEMSNPYREIAEGILNDNLVLRSIEEVKQEYAENSMQKYFYELPTDIKAKNQAIRDKLNEVTGLVRTKEGYLNGRGEVVKRVSDSVAQYYKRQFKNGLDTQEYEYARLKGDVIHKIEQTIMQDLIDGNRYTMSDVLERSKKNLLTEVEHSEVFKEAYKKYGEPLFSIGPNYAAQIVSFTALENTVKAIYNNIQTNQAKINQIYNTQDKAEIFLEKTVYDPTTNTAGTLDLIVLYSNGAVGRYDYKSLDITEKKWIENYKEEAWEIQLSGYTRILSNAYGVDKFAESRIVPIGVKYNRSSKNPLDVVAMETANTPEEVAKKKYLSHVPLKELTVVNENVNKALETLYIKKDFLRKKLSQSKGKDEKSRLQLSEINDSIKKLAFEQDYKFIVEAVDDISKEFHDREVAGGKMIDSKYLSETLDELKLYKSVLDSIKGQFKPEDYDKSENLGIFKAESIIGSLTTKVENKVKDNLIEYREGGNLEGGRELGFFGRNFTQLSDINHPAFRKLAAIVREISNKTREHVNTVYKDIESKKKALEDLAKSKGLSVQDMYDKLINRDGNNLSLIHKLNKEYYVARDKAIENKDYEWFGQNTQVVYSQSKGLIYSGDIQKKFEESRERKIKFLEETYRGKRNEQRRLEELDKFDRKFNINKYADALFNNKNFWVQANDNPSNYTREWKELIAPENKALKDFYDTLIKYNNEFAAITGQEIKHNFIPRIKQDIIQRLAQNGVASTFDMRENILNAMEVHQNDVIKGSIDPVTHEPIASIPLLYTDTIGADVQSRDLAQNLILFADAAYSYKHLNETEHLAKNIRAIVSSPKYKTLQTNAFGKPLKNKDTNELIYKEGMSPADIELYDNFVKQIWYGQTFTGKDPVFTVFGKDISFNKAVLKLHSFMTLKSLGLNPISSAGNAIGAYSNLLIKATEGKYFNTEDIKDAIKLASKDNEKYHAIIEMIQPRAADVTRELANKIAASKIEKNLTMEKMLFMMKNPDEQLENIVLLAMMKNYGVKDGKIVKGANNTLLDLFTKDANGQYSLDIPKDELYRFRQMVLKVGTQIKGSIPQDDKMGISQSIYGYSLMFFKNWMIPLGKDEFGKLRYDPILQDFEAGRMLIAGQQIFNKGGLKELGKLLQEFAFMGGLKKINKDIAARYLDEYIDENPEIAQMIVNGEVTREQLLEQYNELRIAKLKGAINRVRMMLGWFIVTQLLRAAVPDDDEESLQKYIAQNSYMMANRGWLETSFFLSPASANQIVTQPFMLWGLVTDTQKLLGNTFDESRDLVFGEDNNQDKSPFTYYTITRFTPFGKPIAQVTDMYDTFKTK